VNEALLHSIPAPEWAARYEQLRSAALHRVSDVSSGIGLAVFLRQGLTAWMRACGNMLTPSVHQVAQPAPVSWLPFDVRTQTVLILAGMLLGNRSEANGCKRKCRR
jgi:hypothetical protein